MKIDNVEIGAGVFSIAEIGGNHNGDFELANSPVLPGGFPSEAVRSHAHRCP